MKKEGGDCPCRKKAREDSVAQQSAKRCRPTASCLRIAMPGKRPFRRGELKPVGKGAPAHWSAVRARSKSGPEPGRCVLVAMDWRAAGPASSQLKIRVIRNGSDSG